MRYRILLAPEATRDLKALPAGDRNLTEDAIEKHMRHQPMRERKSRTKRLRGLAKPRYCLRVGDVRVFYDVAGTEVRALDIVYKPEAEGWLAKKGEGS